jgi:hypothetical protein
MSVARIKKNDIVIAIAAIAPERQAGAAVLPKRAWPWCWALHMVKKAIRRSQTVPTSVSRTARPRWPFHSDAQRPGQEKGCPQPSRPEGDTTVRKSKASGKNLD